MSACMRVPARIRSASRAAEDDPTSDERLWRAVSFYVEKCARHQTSRRIRTEPYRADVDFKSNDTPCRRRQTSAEENPAGFRGASRYVDEEFACASSSAWLKSVRERWTEDVKIMVVRTHREEASRSPRCLQRTA